MLNDLPDVLYRQALVDGLDLPSLSVPDLATFSESITSILDDPMVLAAMLALCRVPLIFVDMYREDVIVIG